MGGGGGKGRDAGISEALMESRSPAFGRGGGGGSPGSATSSEVNNAASADDDGPAPADEEGSDKGIRGPAN